MFALRTQRLFAPLSRSALPRLSCTRQLCTPAAKPEEPADDGQPKLLYEGGKNKVRACALLMHGHALAEVLCAGAGGDDAEESLDRQPRLRAGLGPAPALHHVGLGPRR
eukprot:scaffold111505_cov63-Phaeocystis_antarctica.AAC.4